MLKSSKEWIITSRKGERTVATEKAVEMGGPKRIFV